jgi:hypothetical protein
LFLLSFSIIGNPSYHFAYITKKVVRWTSSWKINWQNPTSISTYTQSEYRISNYVNHIRIIVLCLLQAICRSLTGKLRSYFWKWRVRYPEKTTDLSQVTDKLYHIMLHRVHFAWAGFKLSTWVVIGTDCISSYKSNYHTITATMAPNKIFNYWLIFISANWYSVIFRIFIWCITIAWCHVCFCKWIIHFNIADENN